MIDQILNFSITVLSMVGFCPQIVPKVSCRPAVFNIGKALGHPCNIEGFLVMLKAWFMGNVVFMICLEGD